ncbi:receptor-interacting serine/threonine-protein kinase 3-like [Heterodontus francisci]|uniref:receptor-interacting serine/threonine-protein kinase 3-like n=1 Tax=Heterodontus francisci TaxID=7792 RepID=UPI00355B27B2
MAESAGLAVVTAGKLADKRPIGTGGFGRILRARHTDWGIDVALKMLHGTNDQCAHNQELLHEAKLMNSLRFRHIVCLIGLYRDPGEPLGIVMEFMENGSLASLQERLMVPWTLKVRLIHEVTLGMNYLHGLKPPLLHLDLNPRNVLLDDGFHAKIADFGLSKLKQIASSLPVSSVAGTLEYLPPEALDSDINQYKPTAATDVYSFGILMWSILSGKQPYGGGNRALIHILIPQNQRPDLSQLPSQESVEGLEELKTLMEECWHNEPSQRPAFTICRTRTEEAFEAHRASVADAVHRVGTILSNLATSSSFGSFSDGMRDLSLQDSASEGIGELRTEESMRPDSPPLAAAVPSLGKGAPTRQETTKNQQSKPALEDNKPVSYQLDSKMSPGPSLNNRQDWEPAIQKPGAQEMVTGASGHSLGSICILSSNIEGLQVGHRNTMNITKKGRAKRKAKR